MILANITVPMVGVVDVAVMGRLPEATYIAAVTMGAAMFSAVYWLFGFLRMGTTGLSAQAYGRGNSVDILGTLLRGLMIAATLGLLVISAQVPLQLLLFEMFGASAEVSRLAGVYYQIRVWGAPGLLIQMVALGLLFGLQRMRDTLWLSVSFNLMNLILDVVLVLGFDLGVAGVAIGTVVSEWTAAALGLFLVLRVFRQHGWPLRRPADLWTTAAWRGFFDVGGNLILRTFFVQLPFLAGSVLAARYGDVTLAVHGVLMQLFLVMTFSLDGFAHTAESLTGYCFGAGKPHALRLAGRYCGIWGIGTALMTGGVYVLFGDVFIGWLTTAPPVREMAGEYLPWLGIAPLLCVGAFVYDGIFIGTTHIREMRNAMLLSAAIWGGVLWLATPMAYHGVWLAMSVFMAVRTISLAAYHPRILRGAAAQKAVVTGA